MRRPIRLWIILPLALSAACADEVLEPRVDQPKFDHTTEIPSQAVTVNNYHLLMSPNEVFDGIYKDQYVFFAGQVAYGTDGEHVYFYDTRGASQSFIDAGISPFVEIGGTLADHYTAAVLVESSDQRGGAREHLDVITVRESFAFAAAPDDDYVIVRYSLLNPSATDIVGANLGFIADPDVLRAGVNETYYDAALGAAITHDPAASVRSAVILLDHPVAHYQHWVNPGVGLGPDVSDPSTYVGWFELLSGTSDAGALGMYDVRNALTTAPVTVPAHGAVALTIGLVAGDDDADLALNIAAARVRFAGLAAPTPVVVTPAVSVNAGDATFTGTITFSSDALAAAFDAQQAACGKAPLATATVSGATVSITFDRLDLDPSLVTGDRVYCSGRLTDGSFFSGFDTPVLPDSRIHITPVSVGAQADWQPSWSPDGHTIAFTRRIGPASSIWLIDTADPDAVASQLTAGLGDGNPDIIDGEAKPDWSPDGQRILFVREGGVFEIDVATRVERQLTSTAVETGWARLDQDARYSPDGSRIVVWRDNFTAEPMGQHLWVMTVAGELGGAVAQRVSATDGSIYPDWSAADGRIYFTDFATTGGVLSVDPDVGAASIQAVTPPESSTNRHPALSPDGRTLAFSDNRLILQDMTLGRHTVALLEPHVFLAGSHTQQNLEFSPDGTRIVFATNTADIWYADVTSLLDPAARAEGLASSVQSLIDAGLIDAAGGATLVASLQDVASKLESGQLGAALNKVNAYINQVNALIRSRRVGEIEGQQLIDSGNALADQIAG